ncbi:MAG: oligopeptidase B, partial [Acidimicrobiia bacterium]|nr:oligopeptidase B [Acidimicrobiia bacterium]
MTDPATTAPAPTEGPPIAKQVPVERVRHGDVVVDPYTWLQDKGDPEVIAYLEAENAFTEASMAHTGALQAELFDEIRGRVLETDLSVPVRKGAWWWYS